MQELCSIIFESGVCHRSFVCDVCMCVSTPEASGMILIPYNWLNKFCNFYVTVIVSIDIMISKHGLRIEACCRNQPIKRKLANTV